MHQRVLVVCVGNICRSPLAEQLLQAACPDKQVTSAGLAAVVGSDVHAVTREVADAHGVSLRMHQARQLTRDMCREADVILVMESGHREAVFKLCPEARGKIFLLAQGQDPANILDPFRKTPEFFASVHHQIVQACMRWATLLQK
ncbi:MAG: low molecular weight protein-tyrosine-phosphatase [Pseudomonadota bacterium]